MTDEIVLGCEVPRSSKEAHGLTVADLGMPVSVPRKLLQSGHFFVRGTSGAGKTSVILGPMASSLMEPYSKEKFETNGEILLQDEKDSIFIFDIGGDVSLFNNVKSRAEGLGRTFRFLSLKPKKSFRFDPFQNLSSDPDRAIRFANILTESMNLDFGLQYGASYYSARNIAQILAIVDEIAEQKRRGNYPNLADALLLMDGQQIRDAEQVRMAFTFLSRYPQLRGFPNDEFAIDMKRALREREVIYIFAPSMGEATQARMICGLALHTALNAAMELSDDPTYDGHAYFVADEFQELAGKSFAAILAQSRKFGISCLLGTQSSEQLKTRDLSLADIVRDNCVGRALFTVTSQDDIDEIQTFSKDSTNNLLKRFSEPGSVLNDGVGYSSQSSWSEFLAPVTSKNDILEISSTKNQFFLLLNDGKGHREAIPTQGFYSVSPADYAKHRKTPLPDVPPPTLARRGRAIRTANSWAEKYLLPPEGERIQRKKKLSELLKAKQSAEVGETDELN